MNDPFNLLLTGIETPFSCSS